MVGMGPLNLVSSALYSVSIAVLWGEGGGQIRGLEHAKTVNPFGEQSWSQAAESEFMSVNRCSVTACCVLEQPSSELF